MEGLNRRRICHLLLFAYFGKISFISCLNVFGLFADFKSDGRLFHIFGPRYDKHFVQKYFCEMEILI